LTRGRFFLFAYTVFYVTEGEEECEATRPEWERRRENFAQLVLNIKTAFSRLCQAGLRIRIHFIQIQHFRLKTNPDPDPIRI
jgi:hypothetical protein